MTNHKIVNREEWTDARNELLVREKEHTRQGDDLARQRRELPWVPGRQGVPLRNRRGHAHAGGIVLAQKLMRCEPPPTCRWP